MCFEAEAARPTFEKDVVCPRCGILNIESGQVKLTEKGQTQLTNLHLAEEAINLYENQTDWLDEELVQRTDGETKYGQLRAQAIDEGTEYQKVPQVGEQKVSR